MPARKMFVNVMVKDLPASKEFFLKLGFTFNPQFTDENAASLEFGGDAYAMLLTEPFFRSFTDREPCDTRTHLEGLYALTCEDRAEVDRIVDAGVAAGGTEPRPAMDHGFMYQRSLADLDGHVWEFFWMNPEYVHAG